MIDKNCASREGEEENLAEIISKARGSRSSYLSDVLGFHPLVERVVCRFQRILRQFELVRDALVRDALVVLHGSHRSDGSQGPRPQARPDGKR